MSKISIAFENEVGNKIDISVEVHDNGVTVASTGPTSQVEHTWTWIEAQWLTILLNDPRLKEAIEKALEPEE